jgi:hypothetical protein
VRALRGCASSSFVDSGIELTGGSQLFFESAGVERFSIRGIET